MVGKADLSNSIEVLESFKLARESWELLYSLEFLDKGERRVCLLSASCNLFMSALSSVSRV